MSDALFCHYTTICTLHLTHPFDVTRATRKEQWAALLGALMSMLLQIVFSEENPIHKSINLNSAVQSKFGRFKKTLYKT